MDILQLVGKFMESCIVEIQATSQLVGGSSVLCLNFLNQFGTDCESLNQNEETLKSLVSLRNRTNKYPT
jgi:hypothetical protein